jgi:flagellar protein FliS
MDEIKLIMGNMRALSSAARARSSYQALDLASRLDGASPHALVMVLYEELLQSLDVMMAAVRLGKLDICRRHADRCQTILIALGGSLDFDQGGGLARSLATVYRSMTSELRKLNSDWQADRLERLRDGVLSLRDAWGNLTSEGRGLAT